MYYYKFNNITIDYVEELSLAVLTYDCKFGKHEEYKKANQVFLQLLKEKECTRCMYDLINMGVIPMESMQWSSQEMIPMLNYTQLNLVATVYSKDIFNKVAVNNLATKLKDTPYSSKVFADKKEAMIWLKNYKEQLI